VFIACEPIFTAVWIVFYLTLHRFLEGIDYVGMSHNMEYTFFVQIFLKTQIIIYIFFMGSLMGNITFRVTLSTAVLVGKLLSLNTFKNVR